VNVIGMLNGLWAIHPPALETLQDIYLFRVQHGHETREQIEARIGQPLNGPSRGYEVQRGVAVIPIHGAISKRATMFSDISGGASTAQTAQAMNDALDDPNVSSIVLDIDSPGGAVDGTQELADLVYAARGLKPTVAVGNGMMASAAMWIGASASKVFATSGTAVIGSIGVLQAHMDVSKAQEKQGVKTTEITAGRYKRIASSYGPLTDEGRATLQDQVDQVYSVMVDSVARGRGVSSDAVEANMAQGRVFIGKQAQKAGLIDGIDTLESVIARAAAGEFAPLAANDSSRAMIDELSKSATLPRGKINSTLAVAIAKALAAEPGADITAVLNATAPTKVDTANETLDSFPGQPAKTATTATTEASMDINQLKSEHPALVTALLAEGHATGVIEGRAEGAAEGRTAGATAERERIQGVFAAKLPGHKALINTLAFDGKTTAGEAALAVLGAERERVKTTGDGHAADARALADVGAGGAGDPNKDRQNAGAKKDDGGKIQTHADAATRKLSQRAMAYQAKMDAAGSVVSIGEAIAWCEANPEN
jgi:signal peptide peptidase SppA